MSFIAHACKSSRGAQAALVCAMAALAPLTASALDFPTRKPGLWQITTNGTSGTTKTPEQVMQQCIDAATDKTFQQMATGMMAGMKCDVNETKKDGNKFTSHSVCQVGPSKLDTKNVTSGDFDKEYTMIGESTFTPPMAGVSNTKSTIVAKWMGPCKADQKPGDMIVNGQKMNLLNMAKPQK